MFTLGGDSAAVGVVMCGWRLPHIHTSPPHLFQDLFSLSRCKSALPMAALRKVGVPLPPDQVELLEENVGWEEFKVGGGGGI